MPKVSIIMPCLNVVKYIGQCLESVMCQTLVDIEMIVVDAGSTDGTLEIVEECRARDRRIRIFHSPKKSYGYQMNLGIDAAHGEYIGIVETDDYVLPRMFEVLYRAICGTDAEYVKAGWESFIHQGELFKSYKDMPCPDLDEAYSIILGPSRIPRLVETDRYIWSGIYRRSYLGKFRFQETPGAAFQDVGMLFQIIFYARKAVYLNEALYRYRWDNSMASFYNPNGLRYVKDEYQYLQHVLPKMSDEWRRRYWIQLVGHVLGRFYAMTVCRASMGEISRESCGWLRNQIRDAIAGNVIGRDDFPDEVWKHLGLFLEDENSLCKSLDCDIAPLWNGIQKIYGHRVVIFGAGRNGKKICLLLRVCGLQVECFCDNLQEKQGQVVDGVLVLSPKEAVASCRDGVFVLSNKAGCVDMENQLLEFGIMEVQIIKKWENYLSMRHTVWAIISFIREHINI